MTEQHLRKLTPEQITALTNHHNTEGPKIVGQIIRGPIGLGGDFRDIMVLLEGVTCGVLGSIYAERDDHEVIDKFAENLKTRIKELRDQRRLLHAVPSGSA